MYAAEAVSFEHTESLTEIDKAWIGLAQRRADEIRAGTATRHDADEVINQARRTIEL